MNLVERTAIELADVITAIVLKRTAADEQTVNVIYGSESERQAQAKALSQRTQNGKTWLELAEWHKLGEVAQKNDAAHRARMAYITLTEDGTFHQSETASLIERISTLPGFWQWCKANNVVFMPHRGGWMCCMLDESSENFHRIDHEIAVMNRESQQQ